MAVAILSGPGHVIESVDDEIASLFAGATVGQPVSEYMTDRTWLDAFELVYHGGLADGDGLNITSPRWDVWIIRTETDPECIGVHGTPRKAAQA